MTGMSSLSAYERNGYRIAGVSFGNTGMRVRIEKAGNTKKPRSKYNYQLLSAAILRAKTPNSASQVAMQARRKLAELLKSVGTEDEDPDLKAAIAHAEKMELIAKRKKKHLEQEEMAERGQTPMGDDEEKAEALFGEYGASGNSEASIEKEFEKEAAKLQEEIEQMEREMSEEMLEDMAELADELMKNEEKMLSEEMQELEGFEKVTDMSPEDVEELKRKHRNDEWRDITKADMDFLKAKFYRLQQEKAAAGLKGTSASYSGSGGAYTADAPIDISVDASMDAGISVSDVGAAFDTYM